MTGSIGTGIFATRVVRFACSRVLVAVALLSTSLVYVPSALASHPGGYAIINNGTVQIGLRPEGQLNTPLGTSPASSGEGITRTALRYMTTNAEGLASGCPCEGWGAADATTEVSGYANESENGSSPPVNMTVVSFASSASTAVSVVNVGSTLRVTHDFHPAPGTPNLYEIQVTMKNISGSSVDARYRRVMDWDVEPTAFSEYVTIQGTATEPTVLYSSNDGFATANPLGSRTSIGGHTGDFTDVGPFDHGALFDLGFGMLPAGGTVSFTMFYGAAGTETDALTALDAVKANVFSLGEPNVSDGPDEDTLLDGKEQGKPNTFIFGYRASGVSLTVDENQIPVGVRSVPLSSIPPDRIPLLADQLESAPSSSPLIDIPLIDIGLPVSSPLIDIPLIDIGLDKVPSGTNPLNSVLLSSIPIDWGPVLAGRPGLDGLSLNALTLAQVKADNTAWSRFTALTLGQAKLSFTLLRGTRLSSILYGGITVNRLPRNFCSAFNGIGSPCTDANKSQTTVVGLDIAGAPLIDIPLIDIPLIDISGGLAGSPLIDIPLIDIPLELLTRVVNCGTGIGQVNCSDPSKTFGDAEAAGALKPGGTLADIVLGLLIRSDFPWEKLAITTNHPLQKAFQDFAGTGDALHYHARFGFTCGASSPVLNVKVQLPNQFRYVEGSTQVTYGAGSAQSVADPVASSDTGFPTAIKWTLPSGSCDGVPSGDTQQVHMTFTAKSGFTLGNFTSKIQATIGSQARTALEQAPVEVVENWETVATGGPNDTPSSAPVISADSLLVGQIPDSGDLDFFRLPMPPPNSKVKVFLSHIPAGQDFDVALFKANPQPLQSSPLIDIPLIDIPLIDIGSDTNNTRDPLAAETLRDSPLIDIPLIDIPLIDISQNRSNADELAETVVRNESGFITIGVAGYNGSHSLGSYVLRVKVIEPLGLPPTCPARTFGFDSDPYGPGGQPEPILTLPTAAQVATKQTAFILLRNRFDDMYGVAPTNLMVTKLNEVAARPEVQGVVITVDADTNVRNALSNWDSNPCSVEAANNVVRKINDVLASYDSVGFRAGLRHIQLLGTDEGGPPMGRIPDLTTLSPEFDNAASLVFTTAGFTKGNALYTSAALGYVLSDDPYGSFVKTEWLGRELFLPSVAVGRAVETPDDIRLQLQQYINSQGRLDASTAKSLVTGYDFLRDGADEMNAAIAPLVATAKKLNDPSDSWTRSTLKSEFTDAKPAPNLAAINAHYDHYRLLPAAPSSPTSGDLYTTADVPAPPADPLIAPTLAARLLFSVGCHSGLNVANTLIGSPTSDQATKLKDWVETYAMQRSAVYFANTGFGYGDTTASALSERLMALFAKNLADGSTTIGEKAVDAKRDYFLTMGSYGVYDEKVLNEATAYGLVFYRFGSDASAPLISGPTPAFEETEGYGLESASFIVDPILSRIDSARGSHWVPASGSGADSGQIQLAHYRPVQPRYVREATVAGKRTGGVIIRELSTQDILGVNPRLGKPTINLGGQEPEPSFRDVPYPANFVNTSRSKTNRGERQKFVLTAGQFRPNATDPNQPTGVERLVTHIKADALYVPLSNTDVKPPRILQVAATTAGSTVTFFVEATDESSTLNAAVLYKEGTLNTWTYLKLDSTATPGQFTGSSTVASSNVEVMAQVWDGGGNVSYMTNKAFFISAAPETKGPDIRIDSPSPTGVVFGWKQAVNAIYSCADDSGVTHCQGMQRGPGETNFTNVADGASVDTTKLGQHEFKVVATNSAGKTSTLIHTYFVQYVFVGFLPPVDNKMLNVSNAGQGIPVKWKLFDANGTPVRDLTTVTSIVSFKVDCNSGLPQGDVEEFTSIGLSTLIYDVAGDQYRFGWDTKKEWKGTCRRLSVNLNDGTVRSADFLFK